MMGRRRNSSGLLASPQAVSRNTARHNPDFAQLTLDTHASPALVLACKTQDQLTSFQINRRPAWAEAMLKRPLAANELAVPAKQRLRCGEQRSPTVPRQHSAGRSQEDLVASPHPRTRDLPAKHRELVGATREPQPQGTKTRRRHEGRDETGSRRWKTARRGIVRNSCSGCESEFLCPTVHRPSRVRHG